MPRIRNEACLPAVPAVRQGRQYQQCLLTCTALSAWSTFRVRDDALQHRHGPPPLQCRLTRVQQYQYQYQCPLTCTALPGRR